MSQSLIRGFTRSCGCLGAETRVTSNTTHGHRKRNGNATQVYAAWCSMKNRCHNATADRYDRYGGRGIKICDRWLESFENFLADMGEPPSPQHSLDRIDVNGNYEPSNCRWATQKEQSNNKQSSRKVTIDGITLTAKEWSERSGVPYKTVWHRLGAGWESKRAVFEPVKEKR